MLTSGFILAQVGINTETPQATLDVAGKPTITTALDGIIAPRLSGANLATKTYTSAQTGALVYVDTAAPSNTGQVVNVNKAGYYYFDGTQWQNVQDAKDISKVDNELIFDGNDDADTLNDNFYYISMLVNNQWQVVRYNKTDVNLEAIANVDNNPSQTTQPTTLAACSALTF